MNVQFADTVHAVFSQGIALRERLEAGETLDMEDERQSLRERLRDMDLPPRTVHGGDALDFSEGGSPAERHGLTRATVCYALACWLDEWLAQYASIGSTRRERLFEAELFGTETGASKFWDEARYAETREDFDALEVMHLCVTFGFRGNRLETPEQVKAWTTRVVHRLSQAHAEWTMPAGLEPTQIDARPGDRAPFRRLAFSFLWTAAVAASVAAALLWRF